MHAKRRPREYDRAGGSGDIRTGETSHISVSDTRPAFRVSYTVPLTVGGVPLGHGDRVLFRARECCGGSITCTAHGGGSPCMGN